MTISELMAELQKIKESICSQVLDIPQNEDIKIISDSPRCFIINVSKITGNPWTPSYYDFEHSTKLIYNRLMNVRTENIEAELQKIIKDKRIIISASCNGISRSYTSPIHPKIIEHLETII